MPPCPAPLVRTGAVAVLLLLLGGTGSGLAGQEPSITVERRGEASLVANDGEIVAPFRITNRGPDAATIGTEVLLPQGWRLLTGGGSFELDAGEGTLLLVGFYIPSETPAGTHLARFRAGAPHLLPETWAGDSVVVEVPGREALRIDLLEAPRHVAAGDSYRARFAVVNGGNVSLEVRLSAEGGDRQDLPVSPALIVLDAGTAASVTVEVETDASSSQRRELLKLEATSLSSDTVRASASVGLDMIPRAHVDGPREGLPMQARVAGSSSSNGTTPFELSGSGTLSEGGHTRVDLLLRGPHTGHSVLGERAEYRARLRTGALDLRVGDHVYGLTPLTDPGTYASGAGAQLELSGLSIRGYHARDRRLGSQTQTAAQVGYARENIGIEASYLDGVGTETGRLWSVGGRFRPGAALGVEAEYAQGVDGTDDNAATSIAVHGRLPRVGYRLRHRRAGPRFPGRHRDLEQTEGSLDVRLTGALAWRAWSTHAAYAFAGIGSAAAISHTRRHYGSSLAWGRAASLELRRIDEEGRPESGRYERQTDLAKLSGLWSPAGWSLRPSFEAGRTRHRGAESEGSLLRVRLQGSFRTGRAAWFSASLEASSETMGSPGPVEHGSRLTHSFQTIAASLGGHLELPGGARVSVNANGRAYRGGAAGSLLFVDARVAQPLFSGHELDVRVRAMGRTAGTTGFEPVVMVGYTVPFRLPALSSKGGGRLSGRVYNAETGEGLADVRVTVAGRVVLTDGQGRLEVRDVEPGTHRVHLSPERASQDMVPVEGLPVAITVREGEEARIEVAMAPAARLSGTLTLYAIHEDARPDDPDPALVDAGPMANTVLELRQGERVRRVLTDSRGRFDFRSLPPGAWTLEVAGELPEWHRVEPESPRGTLEPGAEERLELRVVPERRPIRFIDSRGSEG